MKQRLLTTIQAVAVLLLLAGCRDDMAQQGTDLSGRPIVLTLGHSAWADGIDDTPWASGATRASTGSNHNATEFKAGERFSVRFLSGATAESAVYEVQAGGTTAAAVSATELPGNPQPRYADGATSAEVRCYAPAMVPIVPATFTVETNQRQDASLTPAHSPGFRKSDLMYGEGTVSASSSAINFTHRLARIRVKSLSNPANVTKIEIIGGCRRTVNIADPQTLTPGITLTDDVTTTNSVVLYSGSATGPDETCVLPPQRICQQATVGQPVDFLRVTYGTAGAVTFTMDPSTLAAGKSYFIDISNVQAEQCGHTFHLGSFDNGGTVTFNGQTNYAGTSPGLYHVGTTTFRMVPVKGGTMNDLWEKSGYNVTLSDYYIGETEVTQGLWKAVMGGLKHPNGTNLTNQDINDNYPVAFVSWDDIMGSTTIASGFIDRLNELTKDQRPAGYYFTLPTGAQWEYAARGGIHSQGYAYPGGDDASEIGWYSGNSGDKVHEVAQKRANELGLYDMGGNVQEWCVDYQLENTSNIGSSLSFPVDGTYTDPWLSTTAVNTTGGRDNRLLRGGNFTNAYDDFRSRYRGALAGYEYRAEKYIGLRLCLRKIQVGDVYFSDGSVGAYTAEHPGKTPVGIVFSTEPSAADQAAGYKNGYVMALYSAEDNAGNATMSGGWCSNDVSLRSVNITGDALPLPGTSATDEQKEATWASLRSDLDGRTRCVTAVRYCEDNGIDASNLYAIQSAYNYHTTAGLPEGAYTALSSGWYLPSMGQLYWMMRNLAAAWRSGSTPTGEQILDEWTYWDTTSDAQQWKILKTAGGATDASEEIATAVDDLLISKGLTKETGRPQKYDGTAKFECFSHNSPSTRYSMYSSTHRDDTYIWLLSPHIDGILYLAGNHAKDENSRQVRPVLAF